MRKIPECKNHNPVTSIYGVTSLLIFLQLKACPEHSSESIEGNEMKLDTLMDGHQKNGTVQEP